MYSIYFMKIETRAKVSFHCSNFWPPSLPASTTYAKDGRSDATILGILGIFRCSFRRIQNKHCGGYIHIGPVPVHHKLEFKVITVGYA